MTPAIIPPDDSTTAPPPQAARRSGRNREKTPLLESFSKYVEQTPRSEVEDLSRQLNIVLGAVANGNGSNGMGSPPPPRPSQPSAGMMGGLSRSKPGRNTEAATSAGRMLLDRVDGGRQSSGRPGGGSVGMGGLKSIASAGQLPGAGGFNVRSGSGSRRRPSARRVDKGHLGNSMAPAIPDWKGYYLPKSSSRRNSRAGSELSISMKINAQKALAELGEITDDDEDDDWLALDCMREETAVEVEGMMG
eukprot:CAMPEP_0172550880 /NCGR_PEP_ID=MMETSP1067-20121228/33392_1 /TAXON_ID=265564 ORGANISM="Thalassiosira punctigera, Strain Tpunct2005C2" /NCGR_SAMPLE_ID=MMETSP1067 /ASSEMBLY_ACC=CAM_ASM_000444 /LENGTH=247 /DNA_ID=CAMNT_0013338559 /DNA_START=20 /DNA_END=759 /DNA_ORIENTATION=+